MIEFGIYFNLERDSSAESEEIALPGIENSRKQKEINNSMFYIILIHRFFYITAKNIST